LRLGFDCDAYRPVDLRRAPLDDIVHFFPNAVEVYPESMSGPMSGPKPPVGYGI
jgi:hypothetical protein